MANNRMYLKNTRTGKRIYLAKYYPSTGWYPVIDSKEDLEFKFDEAEFAHLIPQQRDARSAHLIRFWKETPDEFISPGGMYGKEWVLEYET